MQYSLCTVFSVKYWSEAKRRKATYLVVILFWTRTHPNHGARPFRYLPDAPLSDTLRHGKEDEERTITNSLAIVSSNLLHGRNGNFKWGEDPVSRFVYQWKEGIYL